MFQIFIYFRLCIIDLYVLSYFPYADSNVPMNLNHVAEMIQKQRSISMNDFEIIHDAKTNTWNVIGAGIQRFGQMTNWQYVYFFY